MVYASSDSIIVSCTQDTNMGHYSSYQAGEGGLAGGTVTESC